ncbi:MAG: hypothetical protein WC716_14880 [Chitinophagaceae bacterium]|jgi:hypothetical protein
MYDHWSADLASVADYYPGGMMMPGRNTEHDWSRMGSQTQQKDDEIYGKGNTYAFKYRMEDARIIRFFSPDPLHFKYPHNSDYAFSENRFIDGVELEGLEFVSLKSDPKNPSLVVVPTQAGDKDYEFKHAYNAAMGAKVDVVKADNIMQLNNYLAERGMKYSNIYFQNHGTYTRSSLYMKSGTTYNSTKMKEMSGFFSELGSYVKPNGSIILLGCFSAAPQYGGDLFIRTMAKVTGRTVIGNQGESLLGTSLYSDKPIGGTEYNFTNSYFPMALKNAQKWSMSDAKGNYNENIGDLKISNNGTPTTDSKLPMNSPSQLKTDEK